MFFFFNDTATTEIYTLSLHDALPIWPAEVHAAVRPAGGTFGPEQKIADRGHQLALRMFGPQVALHQGEAFVGWTRSEEHTSELQSRQYLVCRLLLEKKKNKSHYDIAL